MALPVVADAADGVLVDVIHIRGLAGHLSGHVTLKEALFLEPIHQDLEDILGYRGQPLTLAVLVHECQPLVVFFVHVVLDHLVKVFHALLHETIVRGPLLGASGKSTLSRTLESACGRSMTASP